MKFFTDTRIPAQPYPELREVLSRFVAEISAELTGNILGVYLVGSLASGDFDLDSDVDFLVVTDIEITESNAHHLQEIQKGIHAMACYPGQHLEGSFITFGDLKDWTTVGQKPLYYFDNGSTTIEKSVHDNNWHVRWILREHGIALLGPEPETLLPPVPLPEMWGEMDTAMHQLVAAFDESLNQPLNFYNSQFGQSFVVLTICRILHTLHTGKVQSKKAGATWAKQHVEPKWIELIDQAWNDREGVRFGIKIGQRADKHLLNKTHEFTKYAVTLLQ